MSWISSISFSIVLFVTAVLLTNAQTANESNVQGELKAISGNMVVYQSYVVAYAVANPGVTGTVADTDLGLPTWFSKNSNISNYVAGGKGFTYATGGRPELAYQLLQDTGNSIFVGIKSAGGVANPLSGVSAIPVPSAIPDGSTVYAN